MADATPRPKPRLCGLALKKLANMEDGRGQRLCNLLLVERSVSM
jgi:hypothetical protein